MLFHSHCSEALQSFEEEASTVVSCRPVEMPLACMIEQDLHLPVGQVLNWRILSEADCCKGALGAIYEPEFLLNICGNLGFRLWDLYLTRLRPLAWFVLHGGFGYAVLHLRQAMDIAAFITEKWLFFEPGDKVLSVSRIVPTYEADLRPTVFRVDRDPPGAGWT